MLALASKFRDMLMNQGANVIQAAAIKTEPVELFDEDKRLLHGVIAILVSYSHPLKGYATF